MDTEKQALHLQVVRDAEQHDHEREQWRRHCGCLKTSAKLKELLRSFPAPPPPPPTPANVKPTPANIEKKRIYYHKKIVKNEKEPTASTAAEPSSRTAESSCRTAESSCRAAEPQTDKVDKPKCRTWVTVYEVAQLVQLSVTATALVLYYLLYCYMQLVYFTLRSAIYFHEADGPMKVTIGVMVITSLVVGLNLIARMEKLIWFI